jgi:ankyrin repeat protein
MIGLFLNFPELFSCKTYDKKKPIDIAIEYNDPEVIKHFFNRRHIQHTADKTDVIIVEEATACSPENSLVSLLEKQYAETINLDHSILYFACHQLHGQKAISHLINPNGIMYRDKQTGLSPLMVAVQHRQLQCVKELLNHRDFTQEAFELVSNASLRTVLHISTKVHNKEITKALFESRFMSNTLTVAADMLGDTPLHACAQAGNVYMTQLLLSYTTDHSSFLSTFSSASTDLVMLKRDVNR